MTQLFVNDFKNGLDLRKSILTAAPGSLQTLDNAVITPGGEIQKRKAFVPVASLPPGTLGLWGTSSVGTRSEQLWVFALGDDPNNLPPDAPITGLSGTSGVDGYIPVNLHTMAAPAPGAKLDIIYGICEYGPQKFFVSGTVTPNPPFNLHNWWQANLVPNYTGFAPNVYGQKVYRGLGSVLYFSGVGDPGQTNPLNPAGDGPNIVNPGAGFIDTATLDQESRSITGIAPYYKQVAIFSRRTCLLYNLDPDPAQNALQQVLHMGALSGQSIVQYGTGDVLFLNDSGVRSLRALNISLAAGVTDVGSPIDSLIQAAIAASGDDATAESLAIVEPGTGRYWLAIGNVIYVLSYWPSAKINAWSTFTLPYPVDAMTIAGTRVFIRSGDNIYLYGGASGNEYDSSVLTVRTPHMSADTPTTYKKTTDIGAMVSGNWSLSVGMKTDLPTFYELAANLSGDTFSLQEYKYAGYGTHIGFTLTCSDAEPSLLGALSVRFQKSEED